MKEWLSYDLATDVIEYKNKNKNETTATLFLRPPCFSNLKQVSGIESLFSKAMMNSLAVIETLNTGKEEISEEKAKEELEKSGAKELEQQFRMFLKVGGVSFFEFAELFKEFLISGSCYLDEAHTIRFNKTHLNQITDMQDFKNMLIAYAGNFIDPLTF